jgi:hypothetical protein
MAYQPEAQHCIAEMRMSRGSIDAHLGGVAKDWWDGFDHGPEWLLKIILRLRRKCLSSIRRPKIEVAGRGAVHCYHAFF